MEEYIKKSEAVDVIVKYPYNIAGKTATAIKMIEDLPSADVVLRAELAVRSFKDAATIYNLQEINKKLVSEVERLKQENETLKDNNEHLAVMLEEAKAEVEKLQNELVIWKQNRFNLFQRLECYEMARQKVASEIFAELETVLCRSVYPRVNANGTITPISSTDWHIRCDDYNAIKKKYTEGDQ